MLLVAMVLGFSAILGRLLVLQVRDASTYAELARGQRVREVQLPATRGSIYDRHRRPLALSSPARAVYADPHLISDPADTARRLAKVLRTDAGPLRRKLVSAKGRFVYLARGLDLEMARRAEKLRLGGIGFLDESRRHYPGRTLAPQVLGFVGVDGDGLAGVELQYQDLLAGKPGHERVEADPGGNLIPQAGGDAVAPVPGGDLVLTVDADLQYRVQRVLARAVRQNGARGGTVIVLEPGTGDILAMATYPWFDLNRFASAPVDHVRNRAVTDVYEPGSVNKVVTAAAALEEGLLAPDDRMRVPVRIELYGKRFTDPHRHPKQAMTLGDVIARSSNVGTIQLAGRLKEHYLHTYLRLFGFGERTGLSFPGESPGILPPPEEWSGLSLPTIAIGQGVAVTPLQMAMAYATIANGGVRVTPRLVAGSIDARGRFERTAAGPTRQVLSAQTARSLTQMLAFAVDHGTGRRAQIPGFWVAGKTGTARKPLEHERGYSDQYVASFMGFAPASRPAIVVAAMLDEPVTEYGAVAAAPLFREVARYALTRLRVPPAPRVPIPPHALPLPTE